MADASAGMPRPLVLGIGTDSRTDDGVGLDVAEALARDPGIDADIRAWPGELTTLLGLFRDRQLVVLVDAVRSAAPGGTVLRWELGDGPVFPSVPAVSTHDLSLATVLELGRTLGQLPRRLIVYGVAVDEVGTGTGRTPAVRAAIEVARSRITAELADHAASAARPPSLSNHPLPVGRDA